MNKFILFGRVLWLCLVVIALVLLFLMADAPEWESVIVAFITGFIIRHSYQNVWGRV